jgi:hypothetical protein
VDTVTVPDRPRPATAASDGDRERSGDGARTVSSYFAAFAPAPDWDELVWWPPDVFALANLVLDHTEGYRFVVAPPSGRRWPPLPDWSAEVRAAAGGWREAAGGGSGVEVPSLVRSCWSTVSRRRDVPLAEVRSGDAWELTAALLTLHALADEACADVAASRGRAAAASFEGLAWKLLEGQGSLSRLPPRRVRIVPKTHSSERGITIRSLSRYLALCYEAVEVRWSGVEPDLYRAREDYNIVLVPWPLAVEARDFRPAPASLLENMDRELFGFFEFAPGAALDSGLVRSLVETAVDEAGRVDAVIFPEASLRPEAIAGLEDILAEHDVAFLVAGVREEPTASALGRNYLHFGVRASAGWERYEQDKHHRWCLDGPQIRQYHLTRSLDPSRRWWEAIDIRERTLHVIDLGGVVTAAPLVCEDLARLDEVADVVRRIGPSLVVAVLLDGPQLATRWPCRYASVIADDPGSAVLTLTSLGMVSRSRPPGRSRSRVVAHWNDRTDGVRHVELAPGAAAVLLSASVARSTVWTADGRVHAGVPSLRLSGVRQLRRSSGRRARGAASRRLPARPRIAP